MKKTAALMLCILMIFSMAACSGSQTQTQTEPVTTEAPASTKDPVEEHLDLIPFVKDGEIYFDIRVTDAIKNFSVKVDGKTVDEAGKCVPFTKDSQITFEGEGDADKSVSVYIVFGLKEDNFYRFNASISQGIDADHAMTRLPKLVSDVLGGNSKILIVITEKPADWDHSLSDKLNDFLSKYVSE
ncbi:MAG: hypothetical protein IJK03_05785 [Oscillospiraceae bacterium]|nr:hypothetical protein [Lachnospiraceae bacterium]MBQ6428269.1 hypothetical protein [Oscillospiraceae bacterium]